MIFRNESVMWAFFEWGRSDMYPILDGLDDPDVIEQVEKAFLEIAEAHPMWQLLSDWEVVHQWRAPPAEQVLQAQPPKQSSGRHDREDIPYYLEKQQGAATTMWCGRMVIEKTCLKGIPVVEEQMARSRCTFSTSFSGRRRTGDCGSFLHEVWQQHFGTTPIKVVLLSVDTAVDEKLGNLDTGHSWDMILSLAQAGALWIGPGRPSL